MIEVVKEWGRVSQGDVYRDVEYIESVLEEDGNLIISKIVFPLIVVLTQDCELAQDFMVRNPPPNRQPSQDKLLISVLVAPAYNADHVYNGSHLSQLTMTMQKIEGNRKKVVEQNNNPRYHYLDFPNAIQAVPSIVDFKHYFSVRLDYLVSIKDERFVCRIKELYREDLSHRFASFLSRIGLPDSPNTQD